MLKVLEPQWLNVAEKFLEKSIQCQSSKNSELFLLYLKIDTPEKHCDFYFDMHYLNEVPFYSKLFRRFSNEPDFINKLKSLLRGDVSDEKLPTTQIRIVQRYLAKDDPNDFRLIEPHINRSRTLV